MKGHKDRPEKVKCTLEVKNLTSSDHLTYNIPTKNPKYWFVKRKHIDFNIIFRLQGPKEFMMD